MWLGEEKDTLKMRIKKIPKGVKEEGDSGLDSLTPETIAVLPLDFISQSWGNLTGFLLLATGRIPSY